MKIYAFFPVNVLRHKNGLQNEERSSWRSLFASMCHSRNYILRPRRPFITSNMDFHIANQHILVYANI
jgi:hypothetical protein